jgi:shikimate kinase
VPHSFSEATSSGILQRIVLTGFMGSGKSTVGRMLAARLGWHFIDLDEEIAHREGRSVPGIFEQSGEASFRSVETAALRDLLHHAQLVLALGGGAATIAANRDLLKAAEHTAAVFLTADFETLYARCLQQSANPAAIFRPLLGDADSARERHSERQEHYQWAANITLDTTRMSPEETVSALVKKLFPQWFTART